MDGESDNEFSANNITGFNQMTGPHYYVAQHDHQLPQSG